MPVTFRYELPEIIKIAKFRYRITLCRMEDVVTENGEMKLIRQGIRDCWAYIDDRRGSLTGPDGLIVDENQERQSHLIWVRYQYDLDIRSTAWIYGHRLKSPPRWFKVLAVRDTRLIYEFSVRLVERADTAAAPVATNPLMPQPLPDGVKL